MMRVAESHSVLTEFGGGVSIETIRDALKSMDAVKRLGRIKRLTRQHSSNFPNHKWYIDLIDLTSGGFLPSGWLLTILDHYSRKAFAFFLKNKRAETVLKAFKPLFDKHKPLVVIGDKGSEWASIRKLPFSVFYLTTTKGSMTTPIERFNRTLIAKLNLLFRLEGKAGWKKKLTSVLSTNNSTEHATTSHTPNAYEVFLGKTSSAPTRSSSRRRELKPGDACSCVRQGGQVRRVYGDDKQETVGLATSWRRGAVVTVAR